jgi:Tol biopolymer transport system component
MTLDHEQRAQQDASRLIREELAAVCADRVFARSTAACRLLSYMVHQDLAGNAATLREEVLAREVFSLGPDFDPKIDSVVRVNAGRLRLRLDDHYFAHPPASVRIVLRKGAYIPTYEWIGEASAPHPEGTRQAPQAVGDLPPQPAIHPAAASGSSASSGSSGRWSIVSLAASAGLCLLALLFFLHRRPTVIEHTAVRSIRPFGNSAELEEFAEYSPDGRTVAFVSSPQAGDFRAIYLQDVTSDTAHRLTQDVESEGRPAWSPDGKRLAFLRLEPDNRKQVVIRTLATGAESVAAEIVGGPLWLCHLPHLSWSPDASRIYTSAAAAPNAPCQIVSIDLATHAVANHAVATHAVQPALPPPHLNFDELEAAVSPDGQSIAFIRSDGYLHSVLMLQPLGGGAARQVTPDASDILGFAWSVDGRSLVVASNRLDGELRLWKMPLDGSQSAALTDGSSSPAFPSINPRQGSVIFTQFHSISNIWKATRAGARELVANGAANIAPRPSPDGRRLLFTSNRAGSWALWISDITGQNAHRLLPKDRFESGNGSWSPDGTRILYECHRGDNNICLTDAAGSKETALTHGPGSQTNPQWSNDGKSMYFTSSVSGIKEVYRQPLDSNLAQPVTAGGAEQGDESSDGRWLYFGRPGSTAGQIQSLLREPVPAAGKKGTAAAAVLAQPVYDWTLAGDDLLFVTSTPSNPARLQAKQASGPQTQSAITTLYPLPGYDGTEDPDLSFDRIGRALLYAVQKYRIDLSVLEP